MSCLDDNTVAAFFDGKLPPPARVQVEAHVDTCSACRHLVASLAVVIGPGGAPTQIPEPPAASLPAVGTLPSHQPASVVEGQVVADRFRVGECIGQGGMGAVYAATHVQLGHRVALKVMSPTLASTAEAVSRFLNEARAAAHIASEHVVRVSDVGTLPGGVPFLAMEYLEGEDLSALVKKDGRIPIAEAIDLVLEALEGIAHAHALGIVHRDLKLSNLFLARRLDGTRGVKVLDFGISKMAPSLGVPAEQSTVTGVVMGTPQYMAPEQLRNSKTVDARADIWAVGVILFNLLTGDLPFEGESLAELILAISMGERPSLRSKRSEVPVGLEQVVMRCLERDRESRWSDAASLARALAPYGSPASRESARRVSQVLGQASEPVRSLPPRAAGRKGWIVPVVAIAALAAGAITTVEAVRGSASAPASSVPAPLASVTPVQATAATTASFPPTSDPTPPSQEPATAPSTANGQRPGRPPVARAAPPAKAPAFAAPPAAAPQPAASARPGILETSN